MAGRNHQRANRSRLSSRTLSTVTRYLWSCPNSETCARFYLVKPRYLTTNRAFGLRFRHVDSSPQPRANRRVFEKAHQERMPVVAGGGDDHALALDAAHFAAFEVGDNGHFATD